MISQGSGTIVMLSSTAARESGPRMGGFSLGRAAIECLSRGLAGEVGRQGVRVVCLRPNFTPETHPEVPEQHLRFLVDGTALGRLPRLDEVAATAAFRRLRRGRGDGRGGREPSCGRIPDQRSQPGRAARSGAWRTTALRPCALAA